MRYRRSSLAQLCECKPWEVLFLTHLQQGDAEGRVRSTSGLLEGVKGKQMCHLPDKWLWSQGKGLNVDVSLDTLGFLPIRWGFLWSHLSLAVPSSDMECQISGCLSKRVFAVLGCGQELRKEKGERGNLQGGREDENKSEENRRRRKRRTKRRRRNIWRRVTISIPSSKMQAESVGSEKPESKGWLHYSTCGDFGLIMNHSKPQFPHLWNGDKNGTLS